MASSSPGQEITCDYIRHMYQRNLENEEVLQFLVTYSKEINIIMKNEEIDDETTAILVHFTACATRCESHSSRPQILEILQFASDTPLLNNKGAKMLLGANTNVSMLHSYPCLLNDMVDIIKNIHLILPSLLETPQKIGLVSLLQKQISICDEMEKKESLFTEIDELQNSLIKRLSDRSESKTYNTKQKNSEDKLKPPEDFRNISVMPEETDLLYQTVFLRRNKAYGRYSSLDHYLDVQFRLYREDCIVPLRQVYEEFIQKDKSNQRFRLESGRIYRNVKILQGTSTSLEHGEVFIIELDAEHCKRIRWNHSRRLIFGSLLLLSFNGFRSTFFAVVSDSDRDSLRENGRFQVQIFRTRSNQTIPRETPGVLLEATSAYFEAYHHVLTALQLIQEDTLPFQQYIVYCNNKIDVPKYLFSKDVPTYDLQPVLSTGRIQLASQRLKSTEIFEQRRIKVLNLENWPSKEELGMDNSQRQAFISALTKEFVLIQGPPGTGKTYIGLQIAKILLHNSDQWTNVMSRDQFNYRRRDDKKPCLLVVCFTNHALDQFVEGIIKFLPLIDEDEKDGRLPEVVRIGNQCKNPEVEKYSIKNLRSKVRRKMRATLVLDLAKFAKYNVLRYRAILKLIQGQNIVVNFNQLSEFMTEKQIHNFKDDRETAWLDWLHVSPKTWIEEANKKIIYLKTQKRKRKNYNSQTDGKDVLNIVTEAEYAYSERSLDEDLEFSLDTRTLGIDINQQLNNMIHNIADKKWQALLREEAEDVLHELKPGLIAKGSMVKSTDLQNMSLENRWKLYRYWLWQYIDNLKAKLQNAETEFNKIFETYKDARAEVDEEILNQASVIAMTTTGAAKYHQSLLKVGPKITIIEEAAEVPEAHIVTTINPHCEHVILIGDHKQLEPKPAVIDLATRYNLSISLFERMLNNGLHYNCLERQHRMRPEISSLVRHMYPVLNDNENVHQYENVKGVQRNLFFITHEVDEDFNEDIKSYSNEHEAEYLKELCSYLIKQGYKGSEITILAAYTGQMFLIRSRMPRQTFEGVNIFVLDNYQGEENEIILLSLVRSNNKGEIGFLKKENRICVALSRAKKGLYIIGNSATLSMFSDEWKLILDKIKSTKPKDLINSIKKPYTGFSLGTALPLYCQNHPDKECILAEHPMDFTRAPEGGCEIPCEMRIRCGHVCRLKCHPYDKDHEEYICKSSCPKSCPEGHSCHKRCHYPDDCNCNVIMERTLPCEHNAMLECYIEPSEYLCPEKMNRLLTCGHSVVLKCHEDYSEYKCKEFVIEKREICGHEYQRQCHDIGYDTRTKCPIEVEKQFPDCRHKKTLLCSEDINKQKCKEYIDKTFDCGHQENVICWKLKIGIINCNAICFKFCTNEHKCERACHYPALCSCKVKVDKVLPDCGHTVSLECSENIENFKCPTKVKLKLSNCGHTCKAPCHLKVLLENLSSSKQHELEKKLKCRRKVEAQLPNCGHEIIMMCWQRHEINDFVTQKCLGLSIEDKLEIKCYALVTLDLDCGHSAEVKCWEKAIFKKRSAPTVYRSVIDKIRCNELIEFELKCGHTVEMKCWKKAENDRRIGSMFRFRNSPNVISECKALVEVVLSCGHTNEIECSKKSAYGHNLLLLERVLPCKTEVEIKRHRCGHTLKIECSKRSKIQDIDCREAVTYTYPHCGHETVVMCCQHPTNIRRQNRYCVIFKGLQTLNEDEYKIPPCDFLLRKEFGCGHEIYVKCHSSEKATCNERCKTKLVCGHCCISLCKTCQDNIIHKECEMMCNKTLICGHECESMKCMQCKPCQQPCSYSCDHSSCTKKCSDVCKPCSRPCTWNCSHFKCSKLCWEICDRPICTKDCKVILNCGHKCPGFCSEPCPQSCLKCDPALFINIHYNESSETKTVTIQTCGHSFEYQFLDEYMLITADKILTKCPKCKTQFYRHPRYDVILKRKWNFIEEIKRTISELTKTTHSFPVFDSSVGHSFENYIGKFMSYLQISKYVERNEEGFSAIKDLESIAIRTRKCINEIPTYRFQNWIDISNAIFRIYLIWTTRLLSTNEELLNTQFNLGLQSESINDEELNYNSIVEERQMTKCNAVNKTEDDCMETRKTEFNTLNDTEDKLMDFCFKNERDNEEEPTRKTKTVDEDGFYVVKNTKLSSPNDLNTLNTTEDKLMDLCFKNESGNEEEPIKVTKTVDGFCEVKNAKLSSPNDGDKIIYETCETEQSDDNKFEKNVEPDGPSELFKYNTENGSNNPDLRIPVVETEMDGDSPLWYLRFLYTDSTEEEKRTTNQGNEVSCLDVTSDQYKVCSNSESLTSYKPNICVLSGLDIVKKLKQQIQRGQNRDKTKEILDVVMPLLKYEPHFNDAVTCPEITTAVGIHEDDWKICKKGHVTPCLLSDICFTCSNVDLMKFRQPTKQRRKHQLGTKEHYDNTGWDNKANTQRGRNQTAKLEERGDTRQAYNGGYYKEQRSNRQSDTFSLVDYIQPSENSRRNRGQTKFQSRGKFQTRNSDKYQTQNTHTYDGEHARNNQVHATDVYKGQERDVWRPNLLESNFGRATETQKYDRGDWNRPRGHWLNRGAAHGSMMQNVPKHDVSLITTWNDNTRLENNPGTRSVNNGAWNRPRGRGQNRGSGVMSFAETGRPQSGQFNDTQTLTSAVRGGFRGGRQRGRGRRRGGRSR